MSPAKSHYQCDICGAQALKWSGQCPACQGWNSLQELANTPRHAPSDSSPGNAVVCLDQVRSEPLLRQSTGIQELDRTLGDGLIQGSVVLLGGAPGIGKSTLLMQALSGLCQQGKLHGLYVTAEESPQQVALRAQRLGLEPQALRLLGENLLDRILDAATQEQPRIMVVDSIQTCCNEALSSAPGSVAQVRDCAAQLTRYAKQTDTAIFLVGHVTKEGTLAGPRILEHMVDTVLYFEGETSQRHRMLRTVKNRFGAVNELGVFAMTDRGLREVSNPSAIFLSKHDHSIPGSVVMVTREGSRPFLVEVQALVDRCHHDMPRRMSLGLEQNRLAMILAVLHRHASVDTSGQDIYINVTGGVRITETAADVAILLAVFSSLRDITLPQGLVVFGELGLSGEIRPVQNGAERLHEAVRHGFHTAIIPHANKPRKAMADLRVIAVKDIATLMQAIADVTSA